jgi:V8-like Glu-specific endopeptidase
VSWRREFQWGAVALGVLAVIGVTGAAFGVPYTSTTARIAEARGAGAGVTEVVNEAGQDRALAYWTAKRMWATAQVETQAAPAASVPKGTPRAVKFGGSRTTGALFYTTGGKAHFCSASVVDSTAGDLVLTAAHCVYSKGFATNVEYVPQYHDGKQPYGVWPVRAIVVANGWQHSHDRDLDFAFLTVGTANGPSIQKRTGGLAVGFNRAYDEKIEVIGHNDTDIDPVRCATKSFKFSATQMEFYCHGFWTGTSGGPWISGYNAKTGTGIVFGVIGGYEAGGNFEWASYSAYFGAAARTLYHQAEHQSTPAPRASSTPAGRPARGS